MTAIRSTFPTTLQVRPWRRRDALSARLLHRSLDRRLAAGEAPYAGRLLEVRAAQLLTTRSRLRIAARWDELAAQARAQAAGDTADLIAGVADVLRADRLVLSHGVAFAATMLR